MKRSIRCMCLAACLVLVSSLPGMLHLRAQDARFLARGLKTPSKVEVEKLAASLEKENEILSSFTYVRPVLFDPPAAGKAGDRYMKALEAFGPVLHAGLVEDLRTCFEDRRPLPDETYGYLEAGLPEVEKQVRLAARSRDGTSPLAFGARSLGNVKAGPALAAMQLARVCYFLGIRDIERGELREAAEHIMLSQFLLQDMARGAPMLEHAVNAAHVPYFLHGMQELLAAARDPELLRDIDGKLQVLQENVVPFSLALEIEKNHVEPMFAEVLDPFEWRDRFPFSVSAAPPVGPFEYEVPDRSEVKKLWHAYHAFMEESIADVEGGNWNEIPGKLFSRLHGKGEGTAAAFPAKVRMLVDFHMDRHWCAYAVHPASLFIARTALRVKQVMLENGEVTLETMGELPYDEAVWEHASLPLGTSERAWRWQPASTPLGEVQIVRAADACEVSLPAPAGCRDMSVDLPAGLTISVAP